MPLSRQQKLLGITIIGAGTLATALAAALRRSRYRIEEVVTRDSRNSLRNARTLASHVGAQAASLKDAHFTTSLTWICVPDDAIGDVALQIAMDRDWKGKTVLHSSGAIDSGVLGPLRRRGAQVGSAHPLMTFVATSEPDLQGVPFALEGDAKALTLATAVVSSIGGKPFRIAPNLKPAYHAFGFFSSPAMVALIVAAQEVGKLAGFTQHHARELMEPIVRQTIKNCFQTNPQSAFSGPIKRGDVATIRKHLQVLQKNRELLDLYRSLGRIALERLPSANAAKLSKLFGDKPSSRLRKH